MKTLGNTCNATTESTYIENMKLLFQFEMKNGVDEPYN